MLWVQPWQVPRKGILYSNKETGQWIIMANSFIPENNWASTLHLKKELRDRLGLPLRLRPYQELGERRKLMEYLKRILRTGNKEPMFTSIRVNRNCRWAGNNLFKKSLQKLVSFSTLNTRVPKKQKKVKGFMKPKRTTQTVVWHSCKREWRIKSACSFSVFTTF